MKIYTPLLATAAMLASCSQAEPQPDAWGNFEATEVRISAETSGKLLDYAIEEGDMLSADSVVAVVDTVQLHLRRQQIMASIRSLEQRRPNPAKQLSALLEQRRHAQAELQRATRLAADSAITAQMLDEARSRVEVLSKEIDGRASVLDNQIGGLDGDIRQLLAQLEQLDDQIEKSKVRNPLPGTVLTSYVRRAEFVAPGTPLYTIASLDTLTFRAFVDAETLANLALGSPVLVAVDAAEGTMKKYPGTVFWISRKAEFTPKMIQTKDERTSLVYAVKIRVANTDRALRIGQPGEVYRSTAPAEAQR